MTEQTSNEQHIQNQIDTNGGKDARSTGNLKVEQAANPDVKIPSDAEVIRQYAKWTDNDGRFHKVPIDGTTAIREPAHEQHELSIEDRDRVGQALALKTPRREVEGAPNIAAENVHNNDIHAVLAGKGVEAAAVEQGPISDGEGLNNGTPTPKPGDGSIRAGTAGNPSVTAPVSEADESTVKVGNAQTTTVKK